MFDNIIAAGRVLINGEMDASATKPRATAKSGTAYAASPTNKTVIVSPLPKLGEGRDDVEQIDMDDPMWYSRFRSLDQVYNVLDHWRSRSREDSFISSTTSMQSMGISDYSRSGSALMSPRPFAEDTVRAPQYQTLSEVDGLVNKITVLGKVNRKDLKVVTGDDAVVNSSSIADGGKLMTSLDAKEEDKSTPLTSKGGDEARSDEKVVPYHVKNDGTLRDAQGNIVQVELDSAGRVEPPVDGTRKINEYDIPLDTHSTSMSECGQEVELSTVSVGDGPKKDARTAPPTSPTSFASGGSISSNASRITRTTNVSGDTAVVDNTRRVADVRRDNTTITLPPLQSSLSPQNKKKVGKINLPGHHHREGRTLRSLSPKVTRSSSSKGTKGFFKKKAQKAQTQTQAQANKPSNGKLQETSQPQPTKPKGILQTPKYNAKKTNSKLTLSSKRFSRVGSRGRGGFSRGRSTSPLGARGGPSPVSSPRGGFARRGTPSPVFGGSAKGDSPAVDSLAVDAHVSDSKRPDSPSMKGTTAVRMDYLASRSINAGPQSNKMNNERAVSTSAATSHHLRIGNAGQQKAANSQEVTSSAIELDTAGQKAGTSSRETTSLTERAAVVTSILNALTAQTTVQKTASARAEVTSANDLDSHAVTADTPNTSHVRINPAGQKEAGQGEVTDVAAIPPTMGTGTTGQETASDSREVTTSTERNASTEQLHLTTLANLNLQNGTPAQETSSPREVTSPGEATSSTKKMSSEELHSSAIPDSQTGFPAQETGGRREAASPTQQLSTESVDNATEDPADDETFDSAPSTVMSEDDTFMTNDNTFVTSDNRTAATNDYTAMTNDHTAMTNDYTAMTNDYTAMTNENTVETTDVSTVTEVEAVPKQFVVDRRNMLEKAADVTFSTMKYCFLDTMGGDGGHNYNEFLAGDTVTEKDEETLLTFDTLNDAKDWNRHADEDTAQEAERINAWGAEMGLCRYMNEPCGQGIIHVGSEEDTTLGSVDSRLRRYEEETVASMPESLPMPLDRPTAYPNPPMRRVKSLVKPSKRFKMHLPSFKRKKQDGEGQMGDDVVLDDDVMADILNEIGRMRPMSTIEGDGCSSEYDLPQNFSDLIANAIAEEAVMSCIDEANLRRK